MFPLCYSAEVKYMQGYDFLVWHYRHLTLDSPETLGGFCGLCGSSVQLGARVRFVRAHGLEKQDKVGG